MPQEKSKYAPELQERMDEAQRLGRFGPKVDPNPNAAYSQETDPTQSPGHSRIQQVEYDPLKGIYPGDEGNGPVAGDTEWKPEHKGDPTATPETAEDQPG